MVSTTPMYPLPDTLAVKLMKRLCEVPGGRAVRRNLGRGGGAKTTLRRASGLVKQECMKLAPGTSFRTIQSMRWVSR